MAPITTNLASVADHYRVRLEAIRDLLKERISAGQVELYHRPISQGPTPKPTAFPAIFVQPVNWSEDLNTTAKYDFWGEVMVYVYVGGNDPAAAGQDLQRVLAILGKLFSDNALNDRVTAAPTFKYFVYPGFWIESRFGPVIFSPALPFGREQSNRYLMAARATFRFHEVLIH
jgi:hypothetical protein